MTYSDVVMWMWAVALLGTLVTLGLAWRGLARTDLAVARLHAATSGIGAVADAGEGLEDATRAAAGERVRLHTRVAEA